MSVAPTRLSTLPALLQRWNQSLLLHQDYAGLDSERYNHVQPWPKHERPQRWMLDLAQQRLVTLQRFIDQRMLEGDRDSLEALEMMSFLATLVGAVSSEKIIPLADPDKERSEPAAPVEEPTREMPQLSVGNLAGLLHAQRAGVPYAAPTAKSTPAPARQERQAPPPPRDPVEIVIEDAVRLLDWGRAWHELPEIIAGLAERPSTPIVRRILKERRSELESRVQKA